MMLQYNISKLPFCSLLQPEAPWMDKGNYEIGSVKVHI
jgi:hypothetical protein